MALRRVVLILLCLCGAEACSRPEPAAPAGIGPAGPDRVLCCRDADRALLRFDGAPADAFKGLGWHANERSDDPARGTYAWARKRAVVYFARPAADDLELVVVCSPFEFEGAPAQSARLLLNGHAIDTLPLPLGWHELRASLPNSVLEDEINTLVLEFAYAERPANAGPDRTLSAAFREIAIVPRGDRRLEPLARRIEGTRRLRLPPGTRTRMPLPADEAFDVALGDVTADAHAILSLSVVDTRARTTELWRGPALDAADRVLPVRLASGIPSEIVLAVERPDADQPGEPVVLELPRVLGPRPGEPARGAHGPTHVFIYMIDTLRPDALGTYGAHPSNSPRIDDFAGDAVVYEHAWSTSSWTLPATASILTGLYPPRHGSRTGLQRPRDPPTPLADLLAAHGFETLFVSQSYIASGAYGLDAGFAHSYVNDVLGSATRASESVRWFLWRHLRRRTAADRPLFAYLHTVDPHHPYVPTDPEGTAPGALGAGPGGPPPMTLEDGPGVSRDDAAVRRYRALYDGEVEYADRQFGSFVDLLKSRGLYDSSLIILVSDHGEEFGEHGGLYHSRTLFEELLEIPLVVKYPHGWHAGARVRRRVSNVDIAATVLDVLGLTAPDLDGESLRAPLRAGGTAGDRVVYAETTPGSTDGDRYAAIALTAATRGATKCIRSGADTDRFFVPIPDLRRFDLRADREERVPVSSPGARRECDEMLAGWDAGERDARRDGPPAVRVSTETEHRLRALGYLEGPTVHSDPKDESD